MAAPTDITGHQIFRASSSTVLFSLPEEPATSFQAWIHRLPAAEQRLISTAHFAVCDAEHLLRQYLQLANVPLQLEPLEKPNSIGALSRGSSALRGGSSSFSILDLSMDGINARAHFAALLLRLHRCPYIWMSSSRTTVLPSDVNSNSVLPTPLRSVMLLQLSARDMIPKRRFANNADLLSTLRAAPDVISKYHICAVQSHQDASAEFDQLPFSAKLHARCAKMTTRHLKSHSNNKDSASTSTQSSSSCLRHLPVAIFFGSHHVSSNYIPLLRDEINLSRHRAFL